jgi:hypothetical protein
MTESPSPAPGRRKRRILGLDDRQRQAQRRTLLLDAALELFGTRGYAKSSIELLCQTAGIGTNSFYELFPNKEAVLIGPLRPTLAGPPPSHRRGVRRPPARPAAHPSTRQPLRPRRPRRPTSRPRRVHRVRGRQRPGRGAPPPDPQRLRRRPPSHRARDPRHQRRIGTRRRTAPPRAQPPPQRCRHRRRHHRDHRRLAPRPRPRPHRRPHRRHRPPLRTRHEGHHPRVHHLQPRSAQDISLTPPACDQPGTRRW